MVINCTSAWERTALVRTKTGDLIAHARVSSETKRQKRRVHETEEKIIIKKMKIEIVKKNLKAFTGQDGQLRDYYWYTGKKEDGMAIRFGSTNGEYEAGETADILLEEFEQSTGRKGFREIN